METIEECNLCGSVERLMIYELKDWLLERDDISTTLVKCANCGLIYQSPRPDIAEIIQHYPEEYEPYQAGLAILKENALSKLLLEIGLNSKVRMITSRKKRGRLLDVGCASGLFLHKMGQNSEWIVEGVEINPIAAQLAKEEFSIKVFIGTLEDAAYPEQSFDVITMWDVLEHLHDPASTLNEVNRILKPNGLLVLRLPNSDSFDARLFSRYWSGLDSPRHLFVFGKTTIQEMLRMHGFSTLRIDTSNGEYMGFLLSLRMYLYASNVKKNHRRLILNVLSHPVLRIILFPIFSIWSFSGYGTQMSVIAMKD